MLVIFALLLSVVCTSLLSWPQHPYNWVDPNNVVEHPVEEVVQVETSLTDVVEIAAIRTTLCKNDAREDQVVQVDDCENHHDEPHVELGLVNNLFELIEPFLGLAFVPCLLFIYFDDLVQLFG